MDTPRDALADDITALKGALASERAKALDIAAELAVALAKGSEDTALIAHQKLQIAKLQRQIYGQRSERSSRLIDQLALTFEELESSATADELAAERAVARTTSVRGFTRARPERNTFPDHLPRERVVIDPPAACECCGSNRLRKLGEDVTRTLESVPRQWKVVDTVREKFTCRDCEKISQAPAPFHAVARGWAGPSLLAMIMFEKFGQHQPLNRQAERYVLEGVPIALSTMADAVGSVCAALDPLLRLVEAHVMQGEASQEVEEMNQGRISRPLRDLTRGGVTEIDRIAIDTSVGMIFSNVIAFFIILTTAAVLNAHGVTNINSATQAAEALRPLAGEFTFLLFALGIIGTGMLAIPVLAGSAAYGVSEAMGWPATLEARAPDAVGFYAIIAAATVIGFGLGFTGIDAIHMLVWSAVLNGVVAVPIMAMMMVIVANPGLMGRFRAGPWLTALGWIGTALMALAVVAMIWSFLAA